MGPHRHALNAGESILDRVLCILGAVGLSQAPEFMQQYYQRLGGALDEAQRHMEEYRSIAARSGQTMDQFIERTKNNADAAVANLATVMQASVERVHDLLTTKQALADATVWSRPFVFLSHLDSQLAHGTWADFKPAVPTTVEGLVYAGTGLVLALALYHGGIRFPIVRWYKRRQELRDGGSSKPARKPKSAAAK